MKKKKKLSSDFHVTTYHESLSSEVFINFRFTMMRKRGKDQGAEDLLSVRHFAFLIKKKKKKSFTKES